MLSNIEKTRIALYHWMLGKGFFIASEAMAYAENTHVGFRKDGVTPAFAHQIWIANRIRTFNLPDDVMELCLILAFLHDTAEDYDVGFEEFNAKYGAVVADGVRRLTKKHRGMVIPKETYFSDLALMAAAAIVKGVDRLHNLSTMIGVFNPAKQMDYIAETMLFHLPMLKKARKSFPMYWQAFESIKQAINDKMEMVNMILKLEAKS
jgi:(p)ppGpp synthase/HD superfamily hydrolase